MFIDSVLLKPIAKSLRIYLLLFFIQASYAQQSDLLDFQSLSIIKKKAKVMKLYQDVLNENAGFFTRTAAANDLVWDVELDGIELNADKLLPVLNTENEKLRSAIIDLLIKLKHPKGLEFISEELKHESLWGWSDSICAYGTDAIELEEPLIRALHQYIYSYSKMDVMTSLGCIQSKKAIRHFRKLALSKDWEIAKSAVENLGSAGRNTWMVRRTLKKVIRQSWSSQIKTAAKKSLFLLGNAAKYTENDINKVLVLGPVSVDHGMPDCSAADQYSLDGQQWFSVDWVEESLPAAPQGFPKTMLREYGTHVFFEVNNGWLFGSERGHYDGDFIFWSVNESYRLQPWTDIYSIFKHEGKILAIGYQIFADKLAGVIFEISEHETKWQAQRVSTLPSPPLGYAIGLNNMLLLKDELNHYALLNDQIVPLQCRPVYER